MIRFILIGLCSKTHLASYHGILHVDGYAGFEQLTANGKITLAACWAHTRRKFYEIAQADGAPIAVETVRRIAQIYALEAEVRGEPPAERLALRQLSSRPLVEDLKIWLERQLPKLSTRGKLAEAIRYALARWEGLCRYLDDGRIELDTNPVERAICPVALGRKNHLFAGSDGGGKRWATMASLLETCKLNGVEPQAWLTDVLTRMAEGHPASQLDDLLPWNWKTATVGSAGASAGRLLLLRQIRSAPQPQEGGASILQRRRSTLTGRSKLENRHA